VDFNVADQLLIHTPQALEEKWEYNGTVHQLFIDYEKAYDLVRREVVYNILTEFCIPMNLVMLIKIHLNEAYINVRVGKDLMHFIFRMV